MIRTYFQCPVHCTGVPNAMCATEQSVPSVPSVPMHQCAQMARQSFTGNAVQRLPLSSICNPDDFSTALHSALHSALHLRVASLLRRAALGKW